MIRDAKETKIIKDNQQDKISKIFENSVEFEEFIDICIMIKNLNILEKN